MKRSFAAVAILISLGLSSGAQAQEPAAIAEAKQRMKEGRALYSKGRFEEARVRFAQACAIAHTDNCIGGLAMIELAANKPLDAYRHFKEYTSHPHDKDARYNTDDWAHFQERMKAAFDQTGHIVVETTAAAIVRVDGADVGAAPLTDTIDVMPGDHVAEGQLGDKKVRQTVNAIAGQTVHVQLTFEVDPPPAPVALAPVGPSTATVTTPPDGEQPPRSGVSTAGTAVRWSLTGAAIVGVGLGAVFSAESHSKANDLDAFRMTAPQACASLASDTCARYQSLSDSQSKASTLSYVFYGIGAASAVGAIAAWLWWPRTQERSGAAWIVPSLGPGVATVQVGGRF